MGDLRCRRFVIEGLNIERLITAASECGMQLHHVKRTGTRRIEGIAAVHDMDALRHMALEGGWRFEEGRYTGFALAEAMFLRHRVLCLALLLACLVAAACCGWIWRIDVTGSDLYAPDVLTYLKQSGIRPPVSRSAVDTDQLEAQLLWRYPDVSWIECAMRGPTLQIRIHQGIPYGDSITVAGSGDVTAARGGVITEVITTAGTAVVKPGQTVRAGELLIRGEERLKDGSVTQVQAGGKVMARVWDAASACIPLTRTETAYTGETFETVSVVLPSFPLWQEELPPYSRYDTHSISMPLGGLFLPFRIVWSTAHAYTSATVQEDESRARASAAEAAYRQLLRATGYDDDFVDKWVEYSMIEDEIVCAYAYGERVIDIACIAQH